MIQQEELKNTIISELGLSSLSEENKDTIISKLGESLLKRITALTLDKLPEDARGEFEALSQSGDSDKMNHFLQTKIPGIEVFIQQEIKDGIEEFKNIVSKLK